MLQRLFHVQSASICGDCIRKYWRYGQDFVPSCCPTLSILLHGPPGFGKTLLAHTIAEQLINVLVEIPAIELVVSGESKKRIREVFGQAADLSLCVLFIDKIDVR